MTSSVWEEDVEAAIIALKASPTARTEAQIQHLMDWMQHVPFFATNAKSQAAKSSICRALCYESYPKSVPIMRQGETGYDFYALMQGSVEVLVDGRSVGQLLAGQCFGDKALTEAHSKRSATVVAEQTVVVAVLGAEHYRESIAQVAPAAKARLRDPSFRTKNDLEQVQKQLASYPLGVISGLTKPERIALVHCETFNGARVQLAQLWCTRSFVRRRAAGGMAVDAPVVATGIYRNFQTANEAFHHCLKIAQTPFPFPYAQFVMLALCLYTLFAPLLICQIVNDTAAAVAISSISVLAYVTMNEVARQLEDPFGHEVNQLPIEELHMDFNERLWVITQKIYRKDEWAAQYGKAEYARSATDIHHHHSQQQQMQAQQQRQMDQGWHTHGQHSPHLFPPHTGLHGVRQ